MESILHETEQADKMHNPQGHYPQKEIIKYK